MSYGRGIDENNWIVLLMELDHCGFSETVPSFFRPVPSLETPSHFLGIPISLPSLFLPSYACCFFPDNPTALPSPTLPASSPALPNTPPPSLFHIIMSLTKKNPKIPSYHGHKKLIFTSYPSFYPFLCLTFLSS